MSTPSTRKEYLDILRVIAGIAVVCIHVSDPFVNLPLIFGGITWWLANILNSFSRISVPLFVMISGALLLPVDKHISQTIFLKKRVGRIIIPLIFWSIFYFIFWRWVYLTPETLITAYASGKLEHLYFLVIMLGLYTITPILWIVIRHATMGEYRYVLIITFTFSLFLGFLHRFVSGIGYQANALTMAFPYICFYLAGHFLSTYHMKFRARNFFAIFLVLGIVNAVANYGLVLLDKNNIHLLFSNGLGQYVYESNSPLIILMTILIFIVVQRVATETFLTGIIKNISLHVFGIYLIHPFVIFVLDRYLHLGVDSLLSPLWAYMILKIVSVFGISYMIVALGRKIPVVKYTFG